MYASTGRKKERRSRVNKEGEETRKPGICKARKSMRGDRWKEKVKENNKERKISMQRMRRRKEKGEREEKRGRRGRVRKGQRWTYKKDIERRKETMKKKRKN